MRIALIAAVTVATMLFSAHPAGAGEGPWCAVISLGPGSVYEDCQYSSIETCRCWPGIADFVTRTRGG